MSAIAAPQLAQDPDWSVLREIIRAKSFSEGKERKLASGVTSGFYFDMKRTLSDPQGSLLVARLTLKLLRGRPCDFIGGLEMGAVPIAASVATLSAVEGRPIPFFWVRKQPKDHGTQSLIEGPLAENMNGKQVVILEDVTTTGGSSLKAVAALREAGAQVATVITIVDRLEGASDNMAAQGLELAPLFTADDFR